MKRLLALAAVLGMCGCVSLKTHREAVEMAEMRGRLEGQDQVLSIANRCVEILRERKEAKRDDSMDALAEESAKQTDKQVGPPPVIYVPNAVVRPTTELPSRGRK